MIQLLLQKRVIRTLGDVIAALWERARTDLSYNKENIDTPMEQAYRFECYGDALREPDDQKRLLVASA